MPNKFRALVLKQALRYKKAGFGAGGSLLKHSLYPLKQLERVLPSHGEILDLGCGEGMLTNLLATLIPDARLTGVDIDPKRIEKALLTAEGETKFIARDILDCGFSGAAAAVINDVLHHHPYEKQMEILKTAYKFLDDDGLLILKEVDLDDKADVAWTGFWDRKLYPADKLLFREKCEWRKVLQEAGFRVIEEFKVRHFWPASRTVFVATKQPKLEHINIEGRAGEMSGDTASVLVTGGTGFIGEHLVRELLTNGIGGKTAEVTLVVRDVSALPEYLRNSKRVKTIACDLKDMGSKKREFGSHQYVFHLASKVAFFAGKNIMEENILPTKNLLEAVSGPKLKRFVYASTMGALDRSKNDDCSRPLDENSAAHPVSFYGKSKLEGEELVKNSGLPYSIVRIPWCYGPGMSRTHHVRVLFEKLMKGSIIFRFNWPGKVSIIEAAELTRIMSEVAASPKAANATYFVSDGRPITFGELFREMGRVAGRKAGSINIPGIFIRLAKIFRAFAPFQLKSLYMDVLSVSTDKLKGIGIEIKERQPDFLLPLARYIDQQKFPSRHRSKALITGAAGGIGRSLSKRFYANGYGLLLVDKAALMFEGIPESAVTADLADRASLERLCERISADPSIRILVNNAGIGARGRLEELGPEKLDDIVKINCVAPMLLSRAFLSSRKSGTIINVASSAAFQPLPYMAVYAASKSFMLEFSSSVAGENPDGVEVITVSPSGTATNFQSASGVKKMRGEKLLDPDAVSAKMISFMGKGGKSYIIGRSGKMMRMLSRILPLDLQVRLWERLMGKMR